MWKDEGREQSVALGSLMCKPSRGKRLQTDNEAAVSLRNNETQKYKQPAGGPGTGCDTAQAWLCDGACYNGGHAT